MRGLPRQLCFHHSQQIYHLETYTSSCLPLMYHLETYTLNFALLQYYMRGLPRQLCFHHSQQIYLKA